MTHDSESVNFFFGRVTFEIYWPDGPVRYFAYCQALDDFIVSNYLCCFCFNWSLKDILVTGKLYEPCCHLFHIYNKSHHGSHWRQLPPRAYPAICPHLFLCIITGVTTAPAGDSFHLGLILPVILICVVLSIVICAMVGYYTRRKARHRNLEARRAANVNSLVQAGMS